MNGLALSEGIDYTITATTASTATLTVLHPADGKLVATMSTGMAAQPFMQWMSNSQVPAVIRMPPQTELVNNVVIQASGMPTHGNTSVTYPLYRLRDEYINVPASMTGVLAVDLLSEANTMTITVSLNVSPHLLITTLDAMGDPVSGEPYTIPVGRVPGALWIGGERIEYFDYRRVANTITLTGLRRATRGTSVLPTVLAGSLVYNGNLLIEAPSL
jgi:hypothetical protein